LRKLEKILKKSCTSRKLKKVIEQSIVKIRVRAGKAITNPKLRIEESLELYRIVAHLIGDGFAGKTHVPYYSNNCKELRYQFKKDLQIFGKIPTYERKTKTVTCLMFPKPISDILRHIFKIEFIRPTKLPKEIFSASDKCKGAFLQALFDDEGCISSNIVIAMNNFNLVNSIKNLTESLDIKTSKITKRKDHKFYYSFSVSEKDIISFKEKIGVIHPKKIKRLNYKLKIKERNNITRTRPLNWTRSRILSLLKRGSMTTTEMSNKLLLTFPGIYHHLNYLKNSKKIIDYGYKNKKEWYLL